MTGTDLYVNKPLLSLSYLNHLVQYHITDTASFQSCSSVNQGLCFAPLAISVSRVQNVQTGFRVHSAHFSMGTVCSFCGVNRPGREAFYSPPWYCDFTFSRMNLYQ
jgi:hypothetical protein